MENKVVINRQLIIRIFISTFLFGLLGHAYRYFNPIFSHDSVYDLYSDHNYWQISLGRFLQPVYTAFRGAVSAPYLIGILSLVWLSISIVLIVTLLNIHTKYFQIAICGILSTSYTLTYLNATYIPWSDIDMLALALSVFSVYCLKKHHNGLLISSSLLACSLALYQSFIQVSIIILMIIICNSIIECKTLKGIFNECLQYLLMLILGLFIYYIALHIVLRFTGVVLANTYNGISDVTNIQPTSFLTLLINSYSYAAIYIIAPETYNRLTVAILNIALLIFALYLIVRISHLKELKSDRIILLFLVVLSMPIGMNFVFLLSKGMVHSLMTFSFQFVYIFLLLLIEKYNDITTNRFLCSVQQMSKKSYAVLIIIGYVIFNNIVFSNSAYLKKDLQYNATISIMTRILDRMEQTEGFIPGKTQVVFVGDLNENGSISESRPGFEYINGTGFWDFNYSVTYHDTYQYYFENILGYPINIADEKTSNEYKCQTAIEKMPVFPAKESCKMIKDVMVVKLSSN